MKKNPLVSVVMPCLNSERTIEQSIVSVLAQDYKNIELIVVDDGSSDESMSIVEKFSAIDKRIVLLRNKGMHGVSYARNLGLDFASGKYICFLDSDDYLLPGSITARVNVMIAKCAKIVHGPYLKLFANGNFAKKNTLSRVSFSDMLKRNYIGNLTGMYDADALGKVRQQSLRHEDYLMWCQLLRLEKYAYSTGTDPVGVYRVSSSSLSGNKFKAFVWHWTVLRLGLQINPIFCFYYQLYYFFASIFERLGDSSKRS